MQTNRTSPATINHQYLDHDLPIQLKLQNYQQYPSFQQPYNYYQFPYTNYQNFPWLQSKTKQPNNQHKNDLMSNQKCKIQDDQMRSLEQVNVMLVEELSKRQKQEQMKVSRKQTGGVSSLKIEEDSSDEEQQCQDQMSQFEESKTENKFNNKPTQLNNNFIDDIQDEPDPELAEIIQELIIFILNNYNQSDEFLKIFRTKFVNDCCSLWRQSFGSDFSTKVTQIFKILTKKFKKFKKTKEEMIKYIFRRAYSSKNRPAQINLNQFKVSLGLHNQNLQQFRSMNTKFIQKQFQNPYFIQLFQNFMDNFDNNFQEQNSQRIRRLRKIILQDYRKGSFNNILSQRKLAWTQQYKIKIKSLSYSFKESFKQSNSQSTNEIKQQLKAEQYKDLRKTTKINKESRTTRGTRSKGYIRRK